MADLCVAQKQNANEHLLFSKLRLPGAKASHKAEAEQSKQEETRLRPGPTRAADRPMHPSTSSGGGPSTAPAPPAAPVPSQPVQLSMAEIRAIGRWVSNSFIRTFPTANRGDVDPASGIIRVYNGRVHLATLVPQTSASVPASGLQVSVGYCQFRNQVYRMNRHSYI